MVHAMFSFALHIAAARFHCCQARCWDNMRGWRGWRRRLFCACLVRACCKLPRFTSVRGPVRKMCVNPPHIFCVCFKSSCWGMHNVFFPYQGCNRTKLLMLLLLLLPPPLCAVPFLLLIHQGQLPEVHGVSNCSVCTQEDQIHVQHNRTHAVWRDACGRQRPLCSWDQVHGIVCRPRFVGTSMPNHFGVGARSEITSKSGS